MIEIPEPHRKAIRRAILASPAFGSVAAFERAAGFPTGDCRTMLRGPAAFSVAYYTRFLDHVRALLNVDIPTPTPYQQDILTELAKAGRITPEAAEAGRALKQAAAGWTFPGLEPSKALMRVWPAPLRALWEALREADTETHACRPPLPTCTSTVWNIAVLNERPAILCPLSRTLIMSRLEMTSLKIGLRALAARIAAGLPAAAPVEEDEAEAFDINAEDRERAAAYLGKIIAAIDLIEAGHHSISRMHQLSGITTKDIKTLKRLHRLSPDLLARVRANELSLNAAAVSAQVRKSRPKSDGTARIGQPPIWPPKSSGSWKTFYAVQKRDPELAARVERQEISVYAAGLACGYIKPPKPKLSAAA